MKNIRNILRIVAILTICTQAKSMINIGDNAELFLTGAVAIRLDNNIFLNAANEESDTIWAVTPGLDLVFGKGSATTGNLYFKEEIRRYSDFDALNISLADVGFNSRYDNGKSKVSIRARYLEQQQNDNGIIATGTIVERDTTSLGFNAETDISEKTNVGFGLTYDKTKFGVNSYIDNDTWGIPIDIYHEMSPKLDLSLGYRYQSYTLRVGDSKSHFFNVGARGEFTPKLNGQLRIGYSKRHFERARADESVLGINSSLTYSYSEKTYYQITISNDFGNGPGGEPTKGFGLAVGLNSQMTQQWILTAYLQYRAIDYGGIGAVLPRSDKFLEGQVGIVYQVNTYCNLQVAYMHRNNNSDLAIADYSNNLFTIGANFRY